MCNTSIFIVGILSAALIDFLPVLKNTISIFELQKSSLKALQDSKLADEQKQKLLLNNSAKVLIKVFKLFLSFFISLMPFIILIVFCRTFTTIKIELILYSYKGIILSSFAFIFYFLIKRMYAGSRI